MKNKSIFILGLCIAGLSATSCSGAPSIKRVSILDYQNELTRIRFEAEHPTLAKYENITIKNYSEDYSNFDEVISNRTSEQYKRFSLSKRFYSEVKTIKTDNVETISYEAAYVLDNVFYEVLSNKEVGAIYYKTTLNENMDDRQYFNLFYPYMYSMADSMGRTAIKAVELDEDFNSMIDIPMLGETIANFELKTAGSNLFVSKDAVDSYESIRGSVNVRSKFKGNFLLKDEVWYDNYDLDKKVVINKRYTLKEANYSKPDIEYPDLSKFIESKRA